jgi:hypothetical protein
MDVGVVLQETFHGSMVEVGSVIDSSNLTRRTAKYLGLPCVPGNLLVRNSVVVIDIKPTGDCQNGSQSRARKPC